MAKRVTEFLFKTHEDQELHKNLVVMRGSRREEVIFIRLRIGHCHFLQGHLIALLPTPHLQEMNKHYRIECSRALQKFKR